MVLNMFMSKVLRHSKETKTTVKQSANIKIMKLQMSKAVKMHVHACTLNNIFMFSCFRKIKLQPKQCHTTRVSRDLSHRNT